MFVLPQELVEAIIDEWKDSDVELRACALVCRAWTPRSQEHLFRSVTLASEKDIAVLDDLFLGSPHLSAHVKLLSAVLPGSLEAWRSPAASRIANALVHLPVLCISFAPHFAYGRRAPDTHGLALFTCSFPSLERIEIHAAVFQTREQHVALLAGHSYLRELVIGGRVNCWECLHYDGWRPAALQKRVTLAEIREVSLDCTSDNARCVIASVSTTNPSHLLLLQACSSDAALDAALEILQEAPPSTERISIDISSTSVKNVEGACVACKVWSSFLNTRR
jgi:hypothetical protein